MDKPNSTKTAIKSNRASSIEHLRIYQLARSLEDAIYDLAKQIPPDKFYPLGNELRRNSAAVAHHIAQTHRHYSYTIKLESIHAARSAAEDTIRNLETYKTAMSTDISEYIQDYTSLIKQSWGLIKYLKNKQASAVNKFQAQASDELVSARG
jgi:four helix bundle protein